MPMKRLTQLLAVVAFAGQTLSAETLSVATDGRDTNPGTEARPFATLERARDEIRRRKATGPLPVGGITVELRGGVYERLRPFALTSEDGGTEQAPITY